MPIGGVVISIQPESRDAALALLEPISEVEVHAADDKGNIVAVIDTETSDAMEAILGDIAKKECILHIGLTYLNSEDEADRIASGHYTPQIFGGRKHEKDIE